MVCRRFFYPPEEIKRPPDGKRKPSRRIVRVEGRIVWPPDRKRRPSDGKNRPPEESLWSKDESFGLQTEKGDLPTAKTGLPKKR